MAYFCFACGTELLLSASGIVGRTETCSKCQADLHCCRNCRFYHPSAYNSCSEPQADRVVEKERSNFCDFFSPAPDAKGNTAVDELKQAQLKKLDDLFK